MYKSIPVRVLGERSLPNPQSPAILINPSIADAEDISRLALSRHKTLIVVGNCWVHYQGRARSKLEPGERILIIKEDGSLLVHRPVGYEPVNWQPPGCIFHTKATGNLLEIHAVKQKPPESVRVLFDKIQLVSALSLDDSGEFSLYASEEDMQKAVMLNPALLEDGFRLISFEKKVEPGFVDVYGVDKSGRLVVVEIKRKKAGKEAAFQLAKYIEAIKSRADREVRGVLAAPSLAKEVQRVLETLGLEFMHLDPRKCAETLRKVEAKKLSEFFKDN